LKLVTWTDEDGYKHQSYIKDHEPDAMASQGIPNDPPSLDIIDWNEVKRTIHNRLVQQGIRNWTDIQRHQKAITSIVNSTIKNYLVALYRSAERSTEDE
jgi:hypothetical protein